MNFKKEFSIPLLSIYIFILALLPVLTFVNALPNEFFFDDYGFIVDNPGIQKVMPLWRHFTDPRTMSTYDLTTQFRPMLPLSLSLNYALSGDSRAGYRVTNLLFHIIAVILVFFFLLELQKDGAPFVPAGTNPADIAFFAAALFAVHPVSGIPINYLSSRDITLMLVFLLSSLIAYARMRRSGETLKKWAAVLVLFTFSILSKTNSIVMPLLIAAYEIIIKKQRPDKPATYARALPFAAIIIALFLYTKYVLHFSDLEQLTPMYADAFLKYPFTQAKLHLFTYLPNFVLPYFLIYMTPHAAQVGFQHPQAILGVSFIIFTLYLAWKLKDTYPLVAFCIVTYWVLFIPDSSVMPLFYLRMDYRPYQSGIFLFTLVGLLAFRYLKPRLRAVLFVGALLYFGVSSFLMNKTWRTHKGLWLHSIQHGPTPVSELNYAMTCDDLNERKEHIEAALRLSPNYILGHIDLGLTLINMNRADEGLEHLTWAAAQGDFAFAHFWLAKAYDGLGMKAEAAHEAKIAAQLDPHNLEHAYHAALFAQNAGDYKGSLAFIGIVEEKQPAYKQVRFLKAYALQMMGNLSDSAQYYSQYLAQYPDDAQAWFNFASLFMLSGKYETAIQHFHRALEINPKFYFASLHLADCYRALKDFTKAEEYAAMYALMDPDKQAVHFNRAFALQKEGKYKEAAQQYAVFLTNNPSHALATFNLGQVHMALKQYKEAAGYFKKALAINPGEYTVHTYLAACYTKLGNPRLAGQHNAAYYEGLFNKALQLQKTGNREEALGLYKEFLAQYPEHPQAYFNMAFGFMESGNYGEAIRYYKKTLALKPDYHEAHYQLSACYRGLGDQKTADRELAIFKERTHQ